MWPPCDERKTGDCEFADGFIYGKEDSSVEKQAVGRDGGSYNAGSPDPDNSLADHIF